MFTNRIRSLYYNNNRTEMNFFTKKKTFLLRKINAYISETNRVYGEGGGVYAFCESQKFLFEANRKSCLLKERQKFKCPRIIFYRKIQMFFVFLFCFLRSTNRWKKTLEIIWISFRNYCFNYISIYNKDIIIVVNNARTLSW